MSSSKLQHPAAAILFREQAIQARRNRLHGSVHLAPPISWQLIGGLLFCATATTLGFFSMADYERVETVTGVVIPEHGTASIIPTRSGVIQELLVIEGDRVQAGQPLAKVRAEEFATNDALATHQVALALMDQDRRLSSQAYLLGRAAAAEQQRLVAEAAGLVAQLVTFPQQIENQRKLIDLARREYERVKPVAERGFVSGRDLQRLEEALVAREQQLVSLQQEMARQQSLLTQIERSQAEARSQSDAQLAGIASQRAAVAQRSAEVQSARGYVLTAPFAGKATAIIARAGQVVSPQRPIMAIVPEVGKLEAQLQIPTHAVGFLEMAQDVRLAVAAFPFERFGTVPARITGISSATVTQTDENGRASPVYIATASIERPWINAYGRRHNLSPDMLLTARIVADKRTLMEWLLDPVYAVGRR